MEVSYTHVILNLLLLLFLYSLYTNSKAKTRKNKNNNMTAPEPSGALPFIGHLHLLLGAQKGPACRTFAAFADTLGPIYSLRFGINRMVVVSGWEEVKECLTTNDRVLATRASIAVGKYLGYNNAIFALAPYGQYWRDIRKLATLQLLSNHRIEMMQHVRLSEIKEFIKDLHHLCAESEANVAISKLIEGLTFNISLRMTVGKRYSADTYSEDRSEASRYKKAIEQALFLAGVFVLSDALPALEWVDFEGRIGAMKRAAMDIDGVIEKWVEEHKEKGVGEKSNGEWDLVDVLLSNIADGAEWSGHSRNVIVKATIMILTLTGSGSTAVTVTWALCLLLNHPNVMKIAKEEIDRCVGREKWVQESDIPNLPYLQAIVKETLRLYPPGPLTGIREAMEDCQIGRYFVSKGTRVVVNIWKLHRDARVWENPDEFQPERFLKKHAHVDVKGQNFEYIPFSSGRRSCPAINLGMLMVHIILARVLQGFELSTIGGLPVDMREGMGIALPKHNPLEVVIKPRLAPALYQGLEEVAV